MSALEFVPSEQLALSPISLYWLRRLRHVSVTQHKSAIVALHSIYRGKQDIIPVRRLQRLHVPRPFQQYYYL